MSHRGPATDRIANAVGPSRAIAAAGACAALLTGCQTLSTYMPAIEQLGIYKLDINQGNYLAQDQVDRLRVGQTRQQVRQILGTPLIQSAFRPDRWDYVYEYKKQGRALEHRNFAVYFVDDRLARWEGDEMPMSVAVLNREAATKTLKPDPSADDRGFFAWFWDLFKQ